MLWVYMSCPPRRRRSVRYLRIPAEDGSRREGSLRSATVDVAVPQERTILHA